MNASSSILIVKALDCLSARSIVTAENIANAGTPSYTPMRVSFEEALRKAASKGDAEVQQVRPKVESDTEPPSGGEMRLDLELANASGTALRYGALIEILNRTLMISSLAITGDR